MTPTSSPCLLPSERVLSLRLIVLMQGLSGKPDDSFAHIVGHMVHGFHQAALAGPFFPGKKRNLHLTGRDKVTEDDAHPPEGISFTINFLQPPFGSFRKFR